jgi:acyl-CoA dehydrogenase
MTGFHWFLVFLAGFAVLSYQRASLIVWTLSFAILLALFTKFALVSGLVMTLTWFVLLFTFVLLNTVPLRRKLISHPVLNFYRKVMPSMSSTEREALAAGTVTWEGDLFRGAPDWEKLLKLPPAKLTAEEQAFINGPVDVLCAMIDDWDITHNLADMPPEMWKYLRHNGFFALIIPKKYGGKEFSAYAHSQILVKIYGRSTTVASTVAVPNSLGPAELLLHYGTEEQKNHYLPRLANGEEIPCFALTGPDAGSDAGSIPDTGVVCWGEHEGEKVLGIRLNFNKRYITLAPVATVVGLAFKLYDPEHLIGKKDSLGITCALIPRSTPNLEIGRRHFPMNIVFQNGPVHGKDVFIPIDYIIGGPKMAGHGWRMLMECLAAGRAISLPASATGGTKMMTFATGAYCRIRRQFNTPIGRFEGIEEVLARMTGHTYMIDAMRSFAASSIDQGEKPAIASAIVKYHATELGRSVANDAMDIHGGKGICLGPKNYLGRGYESIPIAITVEGANILTRNMIIFGQGAMRCHPYIFAELEAATNVDEKERLVAFDKAFIGHLSFSISNVVRSFILSVTAGLFVRAPSGRTKKYYQIATRLSSAFALIADISLITLGGALKRKESISARLGDILSYLYILSTVLKHYHDDGQPADDFPIVQWACENCIYQIQERFAELFQNFPNRPMAWLLQALIFPLGMHFQKPSDKLGHNVVQLMLSPTETRARLAAGTYLAPVEENVLMEVEDALLKSIAVEPIEKTIRQAVKDNLIEGNTMQELAQAAFEKKIISESQNEQIIAAEKARHLVIAVDDFAPEDLARVVISTGQDVMDVFTSPAGYRESQE